jgi:hypothetical protein
MESVASLCLLRHKRKQAIVVDPALVPESLALWILCHPVVPGVLYGDINISPPVGVPFPARDTHDEIDKSLELAKLYTVF